MDKWDLRFMELTEQVGSWASCLRRKVGAIIVKEKRVMATGYNGAPTGSSVMPLTPNKTPSSKLRNTA